MINRQMTVKQKAKQVAKLLRGERPDYFYLKELFRHLRTELKVVVQQKPKKLPYVPLEEEINNYYDLSMEWTKCSSYGPYQNSIVHRNKSWRTD